MNEVYNFSAGPACLPQAVLLQARAELLDWRGTGMSVMEMSHRSKEFIAIAEHAQVTLCELLKIPTDYAVLFLPGGATTQFATVPMNILGAKTSADYIISGYWSKKSLEEAQRYLQPNIINARSTEDECNDLISNDQMEFSKDSAYVYYTTNETIDGMEFNYVPDTNGLPLVADMTSSILTEPVDITKFGVIFASAQKNAGQAGITIAIVRKDLMQREVNKFIPSMFNYKIQDENKSLLNTAPTYAWYFSGLVFDWVKEQGGVAKMAQDSLIKSNKLYQAIDTSEFYINNVNKSARSRINVPFTLVESELNAKFLREAKLHGLLNLDGHRSVGGMRASMYIGMPEKAIDNLIAFMHDFEQRNG